MRYRKGLPGSSDPSGEGGWADPVVSGASGPSRRSGRRSEQGRLNGAAGTAGRRSPLGRCAFLAGRFRTISRTRRRARTLRSEPWSDASLYGSSLDTESVCCRHQRRGDRERQGPGSDRLRDQGASPSSRRGSHPGGPRGGGGPSLDVYRSDRARRAQAHLEEHPALGSRLGRRARAPRPGLRTPSTSRGRGAPGSAAEDRAVLPGGASR